MQRLESLWKLVNAASTVRDMAFEKKAYEFTVTAKTTFYLHAEHTRLTLIRWQEPKIRVRAELQAGFGWRIETEQDDAGVYLVARRRTVIGNLSRAQFKVMLPEDAYIVLKMEHSSVEIDGVHHTLHIPPPDSTNNVTIQTT